MRVRGSTTNRSKKILVKVSRHFDTSLSRYLSLSDATFNIFKTTDPTQTVINIGHRNGLSTILSMYRHVREALE